MKYKKCKACNQKKPLSEFHYSERGLYQRVNRCKDCLAHAHRARRYEMTPEEFDLLLEEQEGLCPLCLRPLGRPCVDHDHETGLKRGLLCVSCNRALGYVENRAWLARARTYLRKYAL